jgi:hypothetical protein
MTQKSRPIWVSDETKPSAHTGRSAIRVVPILPSPFVLNGVLDCFLCLTLCIGWLNSSVLWDAGKHKWQAPKAQWTAQKNWYCAFQKFVESLARPSNCCAAPLNCGVETDSINSRRIAVVRALYYSILLAETSPSLLSIKKHRVKSQ